MARLLHQSAAEMEDIRRRFDPPAFTRAEMDEAWTIFGHRAALSMERHRLIWLYLEHSEWFVYGSREEGR